jgi:hypothetical protein
MPRRLALTRCLTACACACAALAGPAAAHAALPDRYVLPGDAVFPDGITSRPG